MRISDWSSDVCSSDLPLAHKRANLPGPDNERFRMSNPPSIRGTLLKIGAVFGGPSYTTDPCQRVASNIGELSQLGDNALLQEELRRKRADRKSVVSGKSVSVRVDLGGRRIIKKKKTKKTPQRHKTK